MGCGGSKEVVELTEAQKYQKLQKEKAAERAEKKRANGASLPPIPQDCIYAHVDLPLFGEVLRDIVTTTQPKGNYRLEDNARILFKMRVAMSRVVTGMNNSKGDINAFVPDLARDVDTFVEESLKIQELKEFLREHSGGGGTKQTTQHPLGDDLLCRHLGIDPGTPTQEIITGASVIVKPSDIAMFGRNIAQILDGFLDSCFSEFPSLREEIVTSSGLGSTERSTRRFLDEVVKAFSSKLTPNQHRWGPLCQEFQDHLALEGITCRTLEASTARATGKAASLTAGKKKVDSDFLDALRGTAINGQSLEALSLMRLCVEGALFALELLSGSYDESWTLWGGLTQFDDEVFTSATLSKLVGNFPQYGCAHPMKEKMEKPEVVEEEMGNLRLIMYFMGVVPCLGEDTKTAPIPGPRSGKLGAGSLQYWSRQLPFAVLDPAACRIALYLSAIVFDQKKVTLRPIHREGILLDLHRMLEGMIDFDRPVGLREPPELPTCKLFPLFASAAAEDAEAVEQGEGHGPRKEFFDVCVTSLTSKFGATVDLRPYCICDLTKDMNTVYVRFADESCTLTVLSCDYLSEGHQVTFLIDEDEWSATIVGKEEISEVAYELELDEAAPVSANKCSMTINENQTPSFSFSNEKATFCWFNPMLSDANQESAYALADTHSEPYRAYFLAGWLMGAAVVNGVTLSARLPPFFMQELMVRFVEQQQGGGSGGRKSAAAASHSSFQPTEQQMLQLNESQKKVFRTLRSMNEQELVDYLKEVSELHDVPAQETKKLVAKYRNNVEGYIQDEIINKLLVTEVDTRRDILLEGFKCSMIPYLPVAPFIPQAKMYEMIFGRPDSGESNFSFQEEFGFDYDPDFTSNKRSFIFRRVVQDFIEGKWSSYDAEIPDFCPSGPHFKRTLLQFITGRRLLPAVPQHEMIRIRLVNYDSFSTPDLAGSGHRMTERQVRDKLTEFLTRLPTSRTCDNSLSVPNYLDAYLFSDDGPMADYDAAVEGEQAWKGFSEQGKIKAKRIAFQTLVDRAAFAAYNTQTYETDHVKAAGEDEEEEDDGNAFSAGDGPQEQEVAGGRMAMGGVEEQALVSPILKKENSKRKKSGVSFGEPAAAEEGSNSRVKMAVVEESQPAPEYSDSEGDEEGDGDANPLKGRKKK